MIRYMRLQIPYNEFEQLLSEYFQQKMIRQIKLAYVDESTIQVSAVVKIKLKVAEATIPVERIAMGCISTCYVIISQLWGRLFYHRKR